MIYPIRYGIAQTVYFPLIVAGATNFQTVWTPATGESRYIGDGAAAENLGSNPAHEDDGIWSQALTVAESSFETVVLTYSDGDTDIEDQAIICSTILSGQIEANLGVFIAEIDTATLSPTNELFEALKIGPTNTAEPAVSDFLLDRNIMFTGGSLTGQMTTINASSLTNGKMRIGVTAMTSAPSDGDRFVIL